MIAAAHARIYRTYLSSPNALIIYAPVMLPWPQASHLFTCASDPVVTCYKRFAFPPAAAAAAAARPAGSCAHRSGELWDEWRGITLRGGLEVLLREPGSGPIEPETEP